MTPSGESGRLSWKALGPTAVFECVHLYIPHRFFEEAAEHYRQAGTELPKSNLACSGFEDGAVRQVVGALVRGMADHAPNLYAESAAQWLAVHLLANNAPWRALVPKRRRPGLLTDARLARVMEFMEVNKGANLALQSLADLAGISRFHFVRLFKLKTGQTPIEHLYRLRMEAAGKLLTTTEMPVKSIAAACGYRHPAHFVAAFRRFYGSTPSSMRAEEI